MKTPVLQVDAVHPDPMIMIRAAGILRQGGLVAFPTETVYGLGANALDDQAVAKIFAAKGRPATNPIIVHVAEVAAARQWTTAWPEAAERLAQRFWPGPLTLVLPKQADIPDLVTAGGPTIALRIPAHPVARALLRTSGLPLAAPSANRSTHLSPTRAEHVLASLHGMIDLVVDAGPTSGGLESTVVDLTGRPARLLRPGLITATELEAVIGPIQWTENNSRRVTEPLRSPGQLERHYAPRTPLEIAPDQGRPRVQELLTQGRRVGWLTWSGASGIDHPALLTIHLPAQPGSYAAGLYAALHKLDAAGLDRIVVALPPDEEAWLAVRDRLRRAVHD